MASGEPTVLGEPLKEPLKNGWALVKDPTTQQIIGLNLARRVLYDISMGVFDPTKQKKDHIPNGTLMVQIINAHISNTSSGPVSPLILEYTDAVETKLAEQAKKLRCFT